MNEYAIIYITPSGDRGGIIVAAESETQAREICEAISGKVVSIRLVSRA